MNSLLAHPAAFPVVGDASASPDVEQRILGVLRQFAQETPGLASVVLSDAHGLPISALVRGSGATAVTAMGTLLLSAARNVTTNLGLPAPEDITIEAGTSTVLVRCLGGGVTLIAVFNEDTNLGLAKIQLDRHATLLQALVAPLL